jgi:hypothetical protein
LRKKEKREAHKKPHNALLFITTKKIRYANIFIGGAAVNTERRNP